MLALWLANERTYTVDKDRIHVWDSRDLDNGHLSTTQDLARPATLQLQTTWSGVRSVARCCRYGTRLGLARERVVKLAVRVLRVAAGNESVLARSGRGKEAWTAKLTPFLMPWMW